MRLPPKNRWKTGILRFGRRNLLVANEEAGVSFDIWTKLDVSQNGGNDSCQFLIVIHGSMRLKD